MVSTIKSFTDLNTWKQGHKLVLAVYFMAKGSLTELQNQLLIARDVRYLTNVEFQDIAKETVMTGKLLTGIIKSAKSK